MDSVCDNGQTGVQDPDTDVCCPLECGEFCGGDGCGTIPGVDASQCCASIIEQSGIVCGDGVEAPCTQVAGGGRSSKFEFCCDDLLLQLSLLRLFVLCTTRRSGVQCIYVGCHIFHGSCRCCWMTRCYD